MMAEHLYLASQTTWRLGGPAKIIYFPSSIQDIQKLIQAYIGQPLAVLGYGSNVLISDDGFPGAVMAFKKNFSRVAWLSDKILRVEAGLACPKLAHLASAAGFDNLNFLVGIPGSVGGAIMMNAGAHGFCIMPFVQQIEVLDRDGNIHYLDANDYTYRYRKTLLPFSGIVVAATLLLSKIQGPSLKEIMDYRAHTQPLGQSSCGSVFKNPSATVSAGWLIEQIGGKGYVHQGIEISTKHANFMINRGQGSAQAVLELTRWAQQRVYLLTGYQLEPEYQVLRSCFEEST